MDGLCAMNRAERWRSMTDIQTILLSQLNRNLVGAEMAKDIDDVLIDHEGRAKLGTCTWSCWRTVC